MKCKNCGYDMPEGAKFCMKCGTPSEEPLNPEVPLNSGTNLTPDPKSKWVKIIIGLVCVFCVVLAVVIGLLLKNSDEEPTVEEPANDVVEFEPPEPSESTTQTASSETMDSEAPTSEANSSPKEPQLIDYVGMSIPYVKARWGNDIIYGDGWWEGALLEFWYDDWDLPDCVFGIMDEEYDGYGLDSDSVYSVVVYPNGDGVKTYYICDDLNSTMSAQELRQSESDVEYWESTDIDESQGNICTCTFYRHGVIIRYTWYEMYNENTDSFWFPDPNTDPASEIMIIKD